VESLKISFKFDLRGCGITVGVILHENVLIGKEPFNFIPFSSVLLLILFGGNFRLA
jgi:hypothetical protein